MKTYYTYILLSLKDKGYYFGHTNDLEKRLKKHNSGSVKSTKGRTPFILHYFECYSTKPEAFKRELFFKSFDGRVWLITNNIIEQRQP